jgi:hypothetical protein
MKSPRSRKTTTATPTPSEMRVSLKAVWESELLRVKCADALKISRTPARIPMTRKGRTGNTEARR